MRNLASENKIFKNSVNRLYVKFGKNVKLAMVVSWVENIPSAGREFGVACLFLEIQFLNTRQNAPSLLHNQGSLLVLHGSCARLLESMKCSVWVLTFYFFGIMINFYDLAVMEEAGRDIFWSAKQYFIAIPFDWLEINMEAIFISLFDLLYFIFC